MKKTLALFLTIFSLNGYTALPTQVQHDDNMEKTIAAVMKEYQVPGVAVELYKDGVSYSYYAGYANQDRKIPVTQRTIFELGSISKVMTGLLFAQEIDMANMFLTDPANKFVPNLSKNLSDVTLQELATHTSGLPFTAPLDQTQTLDDFQHYLKGLSVAEKPGDQWIYSNVGIGILGYALENATHKSFDELYRRHILNPLAMYPIGLTVPNAYRKFYAQGYDYAGKPVDPLPHGMLASAIAIKASSIDMQHFLSAAIGLPGTPERVFYPMRLTQTAFVKLPDRMQGLGWQIQTITAWNKSSLLNPVQAAPSMEVEEIYDRPVYNGDTLIDKTGSTNGFRAYIAVLPNRKSGIVILANKAIPESVIVRAGRSILFQAAKIA